ncbi:DEAD/DEAH box helicase [uncultured Clostridium sp.]|uniref:DEAD/DEAH box helicase n=1 Tax=uncultured Clostridium sp. TaxID=59620 RepID=UPI0026DD3113|nr:DEAD/DEAH box helicase [uncultured Clostridium sp.]
MELRDYQVECVNKIKEMKEGEKKIAFLSTGAGKTVIMSYVASLETGRVLIVVDQDELRGQTIDKLSIFIPKEEIGSVQGKYDEVDKRVIVATRQSLTHGKSTRMERMLENGEFDLLMVDECHRAVSQYKKIVDRITTNKVLGFTATPWNSELNKVFDGFVYEKDILSLIKEGYLVSPRCFTVRTNVDLSNVHTVAGEFNQGELDKVVNIESRNKLIVDKYLEIASDRNKVLCFCTSIEHAEEIANTFNVYGIKAKNVDISLSKEERDSTIKAFRNGEITVLTNVGILTTGVDIPDINCIIMARPTKSKMLYVQCIGRGLRLFDGKEDCLILDIVDNATKHNLLNSRSVFDIKDNETIQEKEERIEREAEEERLERERIEQERLEAERIEQELILKEISLFNETVQNISGVSSLHWFFTDINKKEVAILSINGNVDYYIFKMGEEFVWLKRTQGENYTYKLEEIERSNNLKELVDTVEENAIKEGSSFISKSAKWKWEQPTPKQVQAAKCNVNSKWGVHTFFSKRNSYFSLKDVI